MSLYSDLRSSNYQLCYMKIYISGRNAPGISTPELLIHVPNEQQALVRLLKPCPFLNAYQEDFLHPFRHRFGNFAHRLRLLLPAVNWISPYLAFQTSEHRRDISAVFPVRKLLHIVFALILLVSLSNRLRRRSQSRA